MFFLHPSLKITKTSGMVIMLGCPALQRTSTLLRIRWVCLFVSSLCLFLFPSLTISKTAAIGCWFREQVFASQFWIIWVCHYFYNLKIFSCILSYFCKLGVCNLCMTVICRCWLSLDLFKFVKFSFEMAFSLNILLWIISFQNFSL